MKKSFKILLKYLKAISSSVVSEDFFGIASEVTYMLTIGVFPFLLFLTSIFSFVGRKFFIDKILMYMSAISPHDVTNLFETFLKEAILFEKGGIVAFFAFIAVLFTSSGVMSSVIKGLNRANNVKETRSFIYVRILSVVMVFVNVIFLFFSIDLVILGNVIIDFLIKCNIISQNMEQVVLVLRFPLAFFFLFVLSCINYYVLPSIDFSAKRNSVVPGALFFCIFWILGSWLFSLYVEALGTYNKVYGTLGVFVVLMIWLFYTSLVMLIGGEINAKNLDDMF